MLKRMIGGLMAMFALGASNAQTAQRWLTINNTQAPVEYRKTRRPGVTQTVSDEIIPGLLPSGNPLKHHWPAKNQRQYRKLLRQVPQVRRSKKCRVKTK